MKRTAAALAPRLGLVLLLLAPLLQSGCLGSDTVKAGAFTVTLEGSGVLAFRHGARLLFKMKGAESLSFTPRVDMLFGFFEMEKENVLSRPLTLSKEDQAFLLRSGDDTLGRLTVERTGSGNLRATIDRSGQKPTGALRLHFACAPEDRFWGFGEQYNHVDLRGQSLKAWVQEQGVGRRADPPFPPFGSLTDSYFPMPYFMDPARGRGFLIENSTLSRFDLCAAEPLTWTAEVWDSDRISFLLFPGPGPAEVVSQLTAEVGRPGKRPPDWAFGGVWLAAQGGRTAVENRLQSALAGNIPVTALWVQDWVGKRHFGGQQYGVKYHWSHDEAYYPDLGGMIAGLRRQGVRFLGYFNPFIVPDYDQFSTAAQKGYAIRNQDGETYVFTVITFNGTLLDVFQPEAAAWFKGFARKAIELGMSGWMADFGEWLPYDAVTTGGDARALHNLYATQWHRLNREALQEAYPSGDYVMFTRSGFSGEHRVAQIVWAGDQEADWSDEDGLPTVVTAGLTLGLSGIPFFSHDIAGFSGGPSGKELFLRWTELGAFTPVMRTHDGLKKLENHRFDSDLETLAHFALMARLHAALLPYFRTLADEAVTQGLPMVRHTVLVDPAWKGALKAHRQWMVGPDLLLAPVVKEGAVSVEVAFPEGQWEHIFTGHRYSGRQLSMIPAPLGRPAAFVRVGRLDNWAATFRRSENLRQPP